MAKARSRLNWQQVWTLYWRELRSAFRDRTIVLNSVLIPIFLFPFLFWAGFSGVMFVSGQSEQVRSRIAVEAWPAGHDKLRRVFEMDRRTELAPAAGEHAGDQIKRGELDAYVQFTPAQAHDGALPGNFEVKITCNTARDRSLAARDRIKKAIEDYRSDWLRREAKSRGISATEWQGFTISSVNIASQKQMGRFLLGLIVPVIFVVMVAVGAFHPAIDSIAGERERNTWETLMSTSADRLSIVTAKYFYVGTVGAIAGGLNLGAMILTIQPILAPLLRKSGAAIEFQLPLSAIPVLGAAAILLAGFVAAGMMIFASFARTFKEGQAMITPFYLAILGPLVFLQIPGLHLSVPLALVPIANVTLMIRDSLSGTLNWFPVMITLIVSLAMIALALKAAVLILRFEDVMLGSYRGSLSTFIQQRIFKSAPPGQRPTHGKP